MRLTGLKLFLILLLVPFISCGEQVKTEPDAEPVVDVSMYLGHWSFDVGSGGVGWLGVRQEENYLDADILWIGGSVVPVSNVFIDGDGVLYVTRSRNVRRVAPEGEERPMRVITSWLEATIDGDKICGYNYVPRPDGMGVSSTTIEGVRLPDVPPAPDLSALEFGEPVVLFNGVDLTGWELIEENLVNGWKAIDGALFNDALQVPGEPRVRYGNLRTVAEFEDFNLKLEVNVPAGSNSGVYLRGMYEIQVLDSYGREPNDHHMGALYSRITPLVAAEKPAGEWQTMDITLVDRHLTVILNGIKIIDNQPVYGPTGGALQSDVFAPGPVFLQGDHGPVSFRNMVLTPVL